MPSGSITPANETCNAIWHKGIHRKLRAHVGQNMEHRQPTWWMDHRPQHTRPLLPQFMVQALLTASAGLPSTFPEAVKPYATHKETAYLYSLNLPQMRMFGQFSTTGCNAIWHKA
jgi:hypothetical protein